MLKSIQQVLISFIVIYILLSFAYNLLIVSLVNLGSGSFFSIIFAIIIIIFVIGVMSKSQVAVWLKMCGSMLFRTLKYISNKIGNFIEKTYLSTLEEVSCEHCGEKEISLVGRQECFSCKHLFLGRKYANCPRCGEVGSEFVICPTCELPTLRPGYRKKKKEKEKTQ